jgi:hypothetical protein
MRAIRSDTLEEDASLWVSVNSETATVRLDRPGRRESAREKKERITESEECNAKERSNGARVLAKEGN